MPATETRTTVLRVSTNAAAAKTGGRERTRAAMVSIATTPADRVRRGRVVDTLTVLRAPMDAMAMNTVHHSGSVFHAIPMLPPCRPAAGKAVVTAASLPHATSSAKTRPSLSGRPAHRIPPSTAMRNVNTANVTAIAAERTRTKTRTEMTGSAATSITLRPLPAAIAIILAPADTIDPAGTGMTRTLFTDIHVPQDPTETTMKEGDGRSAHAQRFLTLGPMYQTLTQPRMCLVAIAIVIDPAAPAATVAVSPINGTGEAAATDQRPNQRPTATLTTIVTSRTTREPQKPPHLLPAQTSKSALLSPPSTPMASPSIRARMAARFSRAKVPLWHRTFKTANASRVAVKSVSHRNRSRRTKRQDTS